VHKTKYPVIKVQFVFLLCCLCQTLYLSCIRFVHIKTSVKMICIPWNETFLCIKILVGYWNWTFQTQILHMQLLKYVFLEIHLQIQVSYTYIVNFLFLRLRNNDWSMPSTRTSFIPVQLSLSVWIIPGFL
jgi:hypothetical protein